MDCGTEVCGSAHFILEEMSSAMEKLNGVFDKVGRHSLRQFPMRPVVAFFSIAAVGAPSSKR
ncbi:hypothetical protein RUM8411_04176 [Ruegeria meonggei]|uniref:Uncharacterized protein n=1 Tax=Ruegeria meonggei TaxID=1446476 RepID=A0A1X7AE65_9RHOB|nr:hypothetical protein RUM8411_04176 [Ruegeria meonggei]